MHPPTNALGRLPVIPGAKVSRAAPLSPRKEWDPDPFPSRPALGSLRRVAEVFAGHADFPSVEAMSVLVAARTSASGAPLRFERQTKKARVRALSASYDGRIFLEGVVPTRERSYHDYFNALVWGAFPRAKAAVNERQYRALEEIFARDGRMPAARTRQQDALAMLDEGGLVLVTIEARWTGLVQALEVGDEGQVHRAVRAGEARVLLFGHALAEHTISSEALVRGLPVCLPLASLDLAPAALGEVADAALAAHVQRDFSAVSARSGGVRALALCPALFRDEDASFPARP